MIVYIPGGIQKYKDDVGTHSQTESIPQLARNFGWMENKKQMGLMGEPPTSYFPVG
jgi:hypothetical protein